MHESVARRPENYGEHIAAVYDSWFPALPDDDPMVETIVTLADGGPVLELGVGTGRLALPLVRRGLEVLGIDASPAMVARLRAKPGSEAVQVTMGDFTDTTVGDGDLPLVVLVFNTFFALLTQEAQVRCMANVAGMLRPGGRFVVEVFVPDIGRFSRGSHVSVIGSIGDSVRLDASKHDPVAQRVSAHHLVFGTGGVNVYPVDLRYAWPAELDLMALLAGLRLEHRWGGWSGEEFSAASGRHVSVYSREP